MSIDEKAEYYDAGGIETMDIIRAKLTDEQFKGFLLGNALKYLCRMNFKGCSERDAEKAEKYCKMLGPDKDKERICDSNILQWDVEKQPERCSGCKNFLVREDVNGIQYNASCKRAYRGLHRTASVSKTDADATLTPDWCPGREE